jgi:glycosyltransferase involved in cell wall biosynthesis
MISVVIPCYNSEEYVGRAIESVLRQTFNDYEIILVDNGSTDNTLSILESYKNKYSSRVKVLQEPKKGAPAARNKGLNEAKGEWIQFLDSDDELLPQKLEEQMKAARHSGADLIIGFSYKHYVNRSGVQEKMVKWAECKNVWKGLITARLGNTSSNLWRKEAVLAVNGWDESKTSSQDGSLLFKMLKQNVAVSFCTVPLTNIHIRENSIHNSVDQKRSIEIANNFIGLRLEIKEYLIAKNRLTEELERTLYVNIYEYLLLRRKIMPEYVKKTLDEFRKKHRNSK